MSSKRNKIRATALAALLLAGGGAAGAATIVVRATGPAAKSFPAGRPMADGRKIVLGPTDQVTVLDARGTRTFKGPGTFDVTAAGTTAGAGTTLAALINQPTERRARIGAVRSVGGAAAPRSPNLWYVEADRSGAHCVTDPAKVTLWRPNMTAEQSYTITGAGRTEIVTWSKGQSARDWPATLPVTNGADYKVAAAGQAAPATVHFVVLPAGDTALDGLASRLIAAKCTAQLDLLVDTANAQPAG